MVYTYTKALQDSEAPCTPVKKKRGVLPPKFKPPKEPKKPKVNSELSKPKPKPITTPQPLSTPTSAAIAHATKITETTIAQHAQTSLVPQPQYTQHLPSRSPTPSNTSQPTHPISNGNTNDRIRQIGNSNVTLNSISSPAAQVSSQEQRNSIIQRKLAMEANNIPKSTGAPAKKAKLTSDDEDSSKIANNKTTKETIAVPFNKEESTINKQAKVAGSKSTTKVIASTPTAVNKKAAAGSDVPTQNIKMVGSSKQAQAKIKEVPKAPKKTPTATPSSAPVPAPAKTRNTTRMVIPTLSAPVNRPARTSRSATQSTSEPEKHVPTTALSSNSTTTLPEKATRESTRTQSKRSTETNQSQGIRSRTATSSNSTGRGKKRSADISEEGDGDEQPKQPAKPTKRATKSKRNKQSLPILDESYKLSIVFHGHTNVNIPAKDINDDELDDAKDLWCCEFEPSIPQQTETSNIVAFCGSYSVLFMDTHLGRYTKKYTHSEIQEIFYCMAWTTLTGKEELLNADINEEDPSCNILAVAGRLGSIKLLNPLQNECYRYLFGHDKAVLKLAFAKAEPRWLLSASADKTVRLWDIGSPTSKQDDSVCLAKFILPAKSGVPSALSISHDLKTVMVGFEEGDMAHFKLTQSQLDTFRNQAEEKRSQEAKSGDKWVQFGALATIETKTIYPEGDEWHEGYIDDIHMFGQDGDESSSLYNKIISRGAEDMEFIIWDPNTSTKKDADILLSLAWPDSQNCTGVRYKVIEKDRQKVLIAGEYDGQIYIYNIGDMKRCGKLKDNSVEQEKPTRILSHPMSSELIRDVCCSNDTRTIVAVDNNNTVFVWNCATN